MDFVFWIIAIVLIVGIVWWLLNRNSSARTGSSATGSSSPGSSAPLREEGALAGGSAAASAEAVGTAGLPSTAGFGSPAEPTPPTTADDEPERPAAVRKPTAAEESPAPGQARVAAEPVAPTEPAKHPADAARADVGPAGETAGQAEEEWETQWSEAGGAAQPASPQPASHRPAADTATGAAPPPASAATAAERTTNDAVQDTGYVHHPEYTEPHAPTLPGAETAAAETVAAETPTGETATAGATAADDIAVKAPNNAPAGYEPTAEPVAPHEGYEPTVEPGGHLAADQPYGAGSASPGPDGGGPDDFAVKGDAGAMVYYEEGHPEYEQTTADVWFESPAHAEAAGFRAPRRTRR
jgi:hypothetical protein